MDEKDAWLLRKLKGATAKEYRRISEDEVFNFSCHKGLSCFATCCSDVNIYLTPYDVLRMRGATKTPSEGFLRKYTLSFLGEKGLPLVMLRMREDVTKSCPFVTQDGCRIYQDRPWSCRIYPLALASSKTGEEFYFVEEEPSCLGFKEEKSWTVKDWNKEQGIDIYDKMNKSYKELTLHDYFQEGKKLNPTQAKLLYMACYDLDKFKRFLFETKFFDIYDVDPEVIEKIKQDEKELLSFGFSWVRFSLFWEATLKLKNKALDELWQSKRKELGLL